MPLIFSTEANHPQKEKKIRQGKIKIRQVVLLQASNTSESIYDHVRLNYPHSWLTTPKNADYLQGLFQADLLSELHDFGWWTDHPESKCCSSCVQPHIRCHSKAGMALLKTNKGQKGINLQTTPEHPKNWGNTHVIIHLKLHFAMHHITRIMHLVYRQNLSVPFCLALSITKWHILW